MKSYTYNPFSVGFGWKLPKTPIENGGIILNKKSCNFHEYSTIHMKAGSNILFSKSDMDWTLADIH